MSQSGLSKKGDASCAFCSIINAEVERYVVFEDEAVIAFLDMRPLFPGHTLLVPKIHYATLGEVPDETVAHLFRSAKLLAGAIEEAMKADGTFIAVNDKVSQSVPHVHIHIVPRRFGDGLKGFFWPRHKYGGREEMEKVQKSISEAVSSRVAAHCNPSQ